MKNCLFVGSFNPITLSHEEIANDLLKEKVIDFLYFLPVNSKKNNLVSIKERLIMINLIKNNQEEILNIYNYSKNGLFNYDVLTELKDKFQITHLVMGSDLFFNFSKFSNYEKILQEYVVIIVKRDEEIEDLIMNQYSKYQKKFILINKKYNGSSSKAREMIKKTTNSYLNLKVLDYIKKKHLYN